MPSIRTKHPFDQITRQFSSLPVRAGTAKEVADVISIPFPPSQHLDRKMCFRRPAVTQSMSGITQSEKVQPYRPGFEAAAPVGRASINVHLIRVTSTGFSFLHACAVYRMNRLLPVLVGTCT